MTTANLSDLANIGPTIENRLREVGIASRAELKKVGAVAAYLRIRKANPGKTMAVCYYLYSLEGALRGVHWDDLPQMTKDRLKKKFESSP